MRRYRYVVGSVLLTGLLSGLWGSQFLPQVKPPSQPSQQEAQKLMRQFAEVQQKLAPLLREAMLDPEVQEKYRAFEAFVEKKIIEINPNSRPLIEERNRILEKIREIQGDIQLPIPPA